MIKEKSIQEVFDVARIEDIVRDYVELKRAGSNLKGLCPFHNEKSPSFVVSPGKNIFKCFGCAKAGGPAQFIMEIEGYSFPESIRHLAKRYNIQLEETFNPNEKQNVEEHESLYILNQFATNYYKQQLWETELGKSIGLEYFRERGFREHTILEFELGFAPNEPEGFKQFALQQSYQLDKLKALGLIGSTGKDFFRNRIIFPIHNHSGKVVAFAGRILVSDPKAPKYINSPETEVYNKSKTLYGLHLAKQHIRQLDQCILVEGYTDVISLHQAGIKHVVASSGTALTEDQIKIIKRHTKNVIILYDGDTAGIKAAFRGIDLLLAQDLNVRIALIPGKEDPDSFVRNNGTDYVLNFLKTESKDFILFKTSVLYEDVKHDPIKKTQIIKDLVSSIAKIEDIQKRSVYLKECSHLLDIEEKVLIESCNLIIKEDLRYKAMQRRNEANRNDAKIIQDLNTSQQEASETQQIDWLFAKDEYQERDIVRILFTWGTKTTEDGINMASFIISNIQDVVHLFSNPLYKEIIDLYTQRLELGETPSDVSFLHHSNPAIQQLYIELNASKHNYSHNWEEKYAIYLNTQIHPDENFLNDCKHAILRFKLKKFNAYIQESLKEMNSKQHNIEETEMMLRSFQEVITSRNAIADQLKTVVF